MSSALLNVFKCWIPIFGFPARPSHWYASNQELNRQIIKINWAWLPQVQILPSLFLPGDRHPGFRALFCSELRVKKAVLHQKRTIENQYGNISFGIGTEAIPRSCDPFWFDRLTLFRNMGQKHMETTLLHQWLRTQWQMKDPAS